MRRKKILPELEHVLQEVRRGGLAHTSSAAAAVAARAHLRGWVGGGVSELGYAGKQRPDLGQWADEEQERGRKATAPTSARSRRAPPAAAALPPWRAAAGADPPTAAVDSARASATTAPVRRRGEGAR